MFLSKHSNGTYYLFYSDEQGKRKRVSTHCQYKTDALRFLQSFKSDEYERRQKAKRKLLSEFLKDFLPYAEANFSKGTVTIYEAAIENFLKITGDLPLTTYTPQHFDAYKTERQKPVKVVTVKDGHKTENGKDSQTGNNQH